MIKRLVHIFRDISLLHKGIHSFKYQSEIYNNSKGDDLMFQVLMDDVSYSNFDLVKNTIDLELNFYVLATPDDKMSSIEAQDMAYKMAVNIVDKLESDHKRLVYLKQFSVITVSHYTDNDSSGVKCSIVFETPSPLCLDSFAENWRDKPFKDVPDKVIKLKVEEDKKISLKPVGRKRKKG